VNIGVVGLGFMGVRHLSCFKQLGNVKIGGVADKVKGQREEISRKFSCKSYEDSYQLIAQGNVDVIDICTPTYLHKELAIAAAEEGKNIICEKPIARTLEDAKEMAQVAEKNKVKFFVGHVVRFFPEYAKIRECIKAGEVGTPRVIRMFRGGASPVSGAKWYSDLEKSGGVLVDMLIHDFDWLRWTIGEVKSVYTQGLSLEKGDKDLALVNVKFKSGVLAHVEGSWAHPPDFPFTTKVEVAGTKGLIWHDSSESVPLKTFTEKTKEGRIKVPESPLARNPWYLELEHFINCIKKDEEPLLTVEDAIEALKISLAALKSLEKQKPVKVGELDG
jgi:predicted dehydrogenase